MCACSVFINFCCYCCDECALCQKLLVQLFLLLKSSPFSPCSSARFELAGIRPAKTDGVSLFVEGYELRGIGIESDTGRMPPSLDGARKGVGTSHERADSVSLAHKA